MCVWKSHLHFGAALRLQRSGENDLICSSQKRTLPGLLMELFNASPASGPGVSHAKLDCLLNWQSCPRSRAARRCCGMTAQRDQEYVSLSVAILRRSVGFFWSKRWREVKTLTRCRGSGSRPIICAGQLQAQFPQTTQGRLPCFFRNSFMQAHARAFAAFDLVDALGELQRRLERRCEPGRCGQNHHHAVECGLAPRQSMNGSSMTADQRSFAAILAHIKRPSGNLNLN